MSEMNETMHGLKADTMPDTQQDTPMTSEGFGLSGDLASHVAEPTMASSRGSFESAVSGFKFDGLKERGLELASSLESQAKANPLLVAGLFGFGALAAGYVFGRLTRGNVNASARPSSLEREQFQAYID